MHDVTILYQGGSGGFLLFYYLMLSGQYNAGFPGSQPVDQLIQQQFDPNLVHDRTQWKSREIWPDNQWCKINRTSPRLFLICNPFFAKDMDSINQHTAQGSLKILLYTDLKLQLRMAWEKQAWWFTQVSRKKFQTGTEIQYMRWILDQGPWDPDLDRIRKIYRPEIELRLEEFVQDPKIPGLPAATPKQKDFVAYWAGLQSSKSQRLMNRGVSGSI